MTGREKNPHPSQQESEQTPPSLQIPLGLTQHRSTERVQDDLIHTQELQVHAQFSASKVRGIHLFRLGHLQLGDPAEGFTSIIGRHLAQIG